MSQDTVAAVQQTVSGSLSLGVWETIGISVFAGFITVALLSAIKFYINKGLLNHINQKIKANTQNIEGMWVAESKQKDASGSEYTFQDQTTITQVGRNIEGKSIYTTRKNGSDETKIFELKGMIKNDVVYGTYENADSSSIGSGSFTLIIQGGGRELNGFFLVYDVELRKVEQWEYKLTKRNGA